MWHTTVSTVPRTIPLPCTMVIQLDASHVSSMKGFTGQELGQELERGRERKFDSHRAGLLTISPSFV